jgi:hypothetical protein
MSFLTQASNWLTSSGSKVVEQLTRDIKFKGLNPAVTGTRGMYHKTYYGRNLWFP